jgi:anti-sigma B factor antagonist
LVTVSGEMDLSSSTVLTAQLEHLPKDSPAQVVVDLSELTFIDSSGLNGLVAAARLVEGRGGAIVFAGADARLDRLFTIVQLGKTVQLMDSIDDALVQAKQELVKAG